MRNLLQSKRPHPIPSSSTPGIRVSNTPVAVDEGTATTALYLVLSTLRHFSAAERSLRVGTWKTPITSGATHDLSTRTLGILGLGGIGLHLAHLVHAFPMRVLYHNRQHRTDVPAWCIYVESIEALCKEADVLSVHVPLREDTRGLVGEREIRAMKRGSVLVNTARGGVVDEEAIIRALEDGHVCPSPFFFVLAATDVGVVVIGGAGRVPRRTACELPITGVPAKRAVAARRDTHAGYRTQDGSKGDDQLEGFRVDGVGQGPRARVEIS